jgi:TATA-binding protein-associated factor
MLQKLLTATVAEEWAREYEATASPSAPRLIDKSALARELSAKTLDWLQSDAPPAYHEMTPNLARIHTECFQLLQAFAQDCKIPISVIPYLYTEVDIMGRNPNAFNLATAHASVGGYFTQLKDMLGRTKKREVAAIVEKRTVVIGFIDRYITLKAHHDVRVSAAFAGAFVAFRSTPDKVSPVVKGIMNGVKVSWSFLTLVGASLLTALASKRAKTT